MDIDGVGTAGGAAADGMQQQHWLAWDREQDLLQQQQQQQGGQPPPSALLGPTGAVGMVDSLVYNRMLVAVLAEDGIVQ